MRKSRKKSHNKIDENDMTLIDKFPEIKLPNKFFKNNGECNIRRPETRRLVRIDQLIPMVLSMPILIMMVT